MRRLLFWSEKGLSEKDRAEARYQSALNDADPVAFADLDAKLQSFALEVHGAFPDIEFGGPGFESVPGRNLEERCYSRQGLVLQIPDGLPKDTVSRSYALGEPFGLTMYNPKGEYVLGVDDDLGVEIID